MRESYNVEFFLMKIIRQDYKDVNDIEHGVILDKE